MRAEVPIHVHKLQSVLLVLPLVELVELVFLVALQKAALVVQLMAHPELVVAQLAVYRFHNPSLQQPEAKTNFPFLFFENFDIARLDLLTQIS